MLLEGEQNQSTLGAADENDFSVPAAITDTGCERDLNEDRYAVVDSASGLAWLVCDGMGGVTGGELAAQLAIDGIKRDLEGLPERPVVAALRSAILEANRVIVLRRQNQAFAQMGTTIVGALFNGIELAIAHVGDSRAYLIRGNAIEQLTVDHTYVQELVNSGQIQPDEALSHPQAHILTKAIGSEPGLNVEVQQFWVWQAEPQAPEDILLLCSDGLYSHVHDEEIAEIAASNTPQRACVQLVELAKERGGYDNITVAIVPVGGQIKGEPPLGYDAKVKKKKRPAPKSPRKPMVAKTLVSIIVLSFLFCLFVILAVAFTLSR